MTYNWSGCFKFSAACPGCSKANVFFKSFWRAVSSVWHWFVHKKDAAISSYDWTVSGDSLICWSWVLSPTGHSNPRRFWIYLFIYLLLGSVVRNQISSRSNCSKNRAREQEPARCSCLGTRPRVLDAQRCSSKVSVGGMTWHRRSPGHDASAQHQTEHTLQASSLKAPHHRSRRLLDSNPVDCWCCIATF